MDQECFLSRLNKRLNKNPPYYNKERNELAKVDFDDSARPIIEDNRSKKIFKASRSLQNKQFSSIGLYLSLEYFFALGTVKRKGFNFNAELMQAQVEYHRVTSVFMILFAPASLRSVANLVFLFNIDTDSANVMRRR